MAGGQWAFILPNWTLKMQASPSIPTPSINQNPATINGAMSVKKTTMSSRPPLTPRLRLLAHAKIVLRERYLAKNIAGTIVEILARRE
jgi:hypothetical protein